MHYVCAARSLGRKTVSHKACQTTIGHVTCQRYSTTRRLAAPEEPSTRRPYDKDPPTASTTHFGFRDVPEQLKESLVGGVFSSVASSYDVMNDVMSFGVHRLWKDHFVRKLDPGSRGSFHPQQILDVAGGTGDIAFRHLDHATDVNHDHETCVHVVDINPDMLAHGMVRARSSRYADNSTPVQLDSKGLPIPGNQKLPDGSLSSGIVGPRLRFSVGNAESLPAIPSESIDIYTIAFGIRNVTHIDRVLAEAYRVLKPGGVFSCLEFSSVRPVAPLTRSSFSTAHDGDEGYTTSSFYGGHPQSTTTLPRGAGQQQRQESINTPFDRLRSVFSRVYEGYSFAVIPMMGSLIAGDRDSYQYLVESIAKFPDQETFSGMIRDAGFVYPGTPPPPPSPRSPGGRDSVAEEEVVHESGSLEGKAYENLSLGIAAIHTGIKPRS